MRKPFVAGNWKMNTSRATAVTLAKAVAGECASVPAVDVAVCPPFPYLQAVADALAGGPVALGGQNAYFEKEGAFTGEVSPLMLKDIGCRYVILGHSERRHVMGEKDDLIARKVAACLDTGLQVILCVGELIEERRAGKTADVVKRQFLAGLEKVDASRMASVTIAYEPVWAIGTGETATPAQAQEVHKLIRGLASERFGAGVAQALRIQYGGSVKPENAAELMSQPDVDGALVGGAALKAASFVAIVKAAVSK
ncbi:MAG TPA: triose-phosphate isomerase [Candidatus Brocadiia bacterium]|nr:triose-phosphate isomerase [Candidatus Brocadiia bacterium]